jgi:hypothetical protein
MRADRRLLWCVIGMAGVVFAGACGDGGNGVRSEAGIARPADGAAPGVSVSSTIAPASSAAVASTPRPAPTTTPTTAAPVADVVAMHHQPVYVDGAPQATMTPSRAPAGTRVTLDGYGFIGDPWQVGDGYMWMTSTEEQGDCYLIAQPEFDVHVSDDGHLTGSFVVPGTASCRFTIEDRIMTTAGLRYDIEYHQCGNACILGTFTVILPGESMAEPTGTRCDQRVDFGGGENVAGEIYADGLSCEEAESFLRVHAGPLGPTTGPAHIEAEGFSCNRTGRSDVHLPRANYTCTRGAQAIWFIRT